MSLLETRVDRATTLRGEFPKLGAFLRRDLLIALSYRMSFITDWIAMIVQVVVFNFIGRIVRPDAIPSFNGNQATYMEFVAIGIAVSSFMAVGLGRVNAAIRSEQVQGTLESLLLTPTAFTTIQLGSVVYDIVYVPIRTFIFLGLTSLVFGTDYHWGGLVPAALVILAFIPFVWGLGVLSAAWTLTFKRGTGLIGLITTGLALGSGTYFPTSVFPSWAQELFRFSPVTIALKAVREAMLGGAGFGATLPHVLVLIPFAAVSLFLGVKAFGIALDRERRRGSLGLY